MEAVKIVIPSHKRPDRVITKQVVNHAIICIPESQEAEYRAHNPETELVLHPDSVKGLTLKRQWIYEHFGNAFMLDDDIVSCKRLYAGAGEPANLTDPQAVYDLIQITAQAARQAGAYLFGFNKNPNPLAFRSSKPVELTGYVTGCAHGLLAGSKLYYHPDIRCNEDYWISGLNAYHHRYIYKDTRFYFAQRDTFVNRGGLSDYRNIDAEKADFEFLRRMFGEAIQQKQDTKQRKRKHPYEKTLKLPY